jgi:hypothetical protein
MERMSFPNGIKQRPQLWRWGRFRPRPPKAPEHYPRANCAGSLVEGGRDRGHEAAPEEEKRTKSCPKLPLTPLCSQRLLRSVRWVAQFSSVASTPRFGTAASGTAFPRSFPDDSSVHRTFQRWVELGFWISSGLASWRSARSLRGLIGAPVAALPHRHSSFSCAS